MKEHTGPTMPLHVLANRRTTLSSSLIGFLSPRSFDRLPARLHLRTSSRNLHHTHEADR